MAAVLFAGTAVAAQEAPPPSAAPLIAQVPQVDNPLEFPAVDYFPDASLWRGLGTCGMVFSRVRVVNPQPVVGEPLILEFQYWAPPTNQPDTPSRFAASTTFGRDLLVQVDPPVGGPFRYVPRELGQAGASTSGGALLRGQSMTIRIPAAYDPDTLSYALFETPGLHQIVVATTCPENLRLETQERASAPAIFDVRVQPASGDDLVAWEILRGTGAYDSLHSLNVREPEHAALLERVVREAKGAAVRPFCLLALARYGAELEGADPQDQAQMALTFSQVLVREYPHHVLSRSALGLMLSMYERLGLEENAWEVFRTIWNDPYYQQGLGVSTKSLQDYVVTVGATDEVRPEPVPEWELLGNKGEPVSTATDE